MAFTISGIGNYSGISFTTTQPAPPQPFLWAWGSGSSGQLGLGNTTYISSPTQVGSLATWTKVFPGNYGLSHAIKSDGTLWGWGQNGNGQLGLGNTTDYSSPKQVGALTTWSTMSKGTYFTIAIKTDGTMWSWGYNYYKNLGLGDTTNRSSPVQIGNGTTWVSCASGQQHTIAVKTDGTLWAWGTNASFGQGGALGFGTYSTKSDPTQVGAGATWAKVSAIAGASFAIKTDGTLWSWGRNSYGHLGLGDTTNTYSPQQVGSLTDWSTLAIGGDSASSAMFAIRTNGTMWAWGKNFNWGKLGLGDTIARSSPTQIGALTTWSKVANGSNFGAAIKTDGTLWMWGRNGYGELGLGSTSYGINSPSQVGSLIQWANVSAGASYTLAIGTQ
jgi:alpha-tubulin suppressor-like RCC1 family protein